MPRPRKLIKTNEAAKLIGCSSKSIKRGSYGFQLFPQNPNSKRPVWMVEELEVKAFLEDRLRQGK